MKTIFNFQFSIFKRASKGFTLIELLTVIAIIGVLMAFLTANFIGVRARSRDAQRKSDLRQIQSALELYRADNDAYPASLAACGGQFVGTGATPPLYMQKIPCDPQGGSYTYTQGATGAPANCSLYQLAACVENTGDTDTNIYTTTISGVTCSSGKFYMLCNP